MVYGDGELNSPGFGLSAKKGNFKALAELDELQDDQFDLPVIAPLRHGSLIRRRSSRISKNNNYDNYFLNGSINPFQKETSLMGGVAI